MILALWSCACTTIEARVAASCVCFCRRVAGLAIAARADGRNEPESSRTVDRTKPAKNNDGSCDEKVTPNPRDPVRVSIPSRGRIGARRCPGKCKPLDAGWRQIGAPLAVLLGPRGGSVPPCHSPLQPSDPTVRVTSTASHLNKVESRLALGRPLPLSARLRCRWLVNRSGPMRSSRDAGRDY